MSSPLMNRVLVLALWIWAASLMAPAAADLKNPLIPPEIQKQLNLPEEKIDIAIAALTFAREFYPNLDIEAYSKRIDQIADKARRLARGTNDPEMRIRILNTVIHQMEGFRYDRSPFARSRQEYRFLNGILDTRQGTCYTIPLLYMAVAQRLGYPLYPVLAPDHIFVRYVDPGFREQNIETTSGGKHFPDEFYIQSFVVSKKGLKSGSYMRTLTYHQFLGYMLLPSAVVHGRHAATPKVVAYLEKAIELDPKIADYYDNLRIVYTELSEANSHLAGRFKGQAEAYARKARELGFVDPDEVKRAQQIRGRS